MKTPEKDFFLTLLDFDKLGTEWVPDDDKAQLIENLRSGEYDRPLIVASINLAKGIARDVSEQVARELADLIQPHATIRRNLFDFIEDHTGVRYANEIRHQLAA